MKLYRIVILLCLICSSSCKQEVVSEDFNAIVYSKRIKFENYILKSLTNINDTTLRVLYDSLSKDSSFISFYTVIGGNVYCSNNGRTWNFANYEAYKGSIKNDSLNINLGLGILSFDEIAKNEVIVSNHLPGSHQVDSVLSFEYTFGEFSPVFNIFFDAKKISIPNKMVLSKKITAKSSSYTNGRIIPIDSIKL